MSYRINRSDGELLVDLIDGVIDTTATDITLIGKNYKGFGELLNENFIKLLENFASTAQPANPMIGQLWYDKQDQRLKIYNGTVFRSATGTIVNSNQPTNLIAGDLWVDNKNNKLYIYDGSDLTLVGPNYDASQLKTGFEATSQLDSADIQRTILKLFIGGSLVGIYSPETFFIPPQYAIGGLSIDPTDTNVPQRQRLYKGFNVANLDLETGTNGFWYNGTVTRAKSLIDDNGVIRDTNDFLPTNANGVTSGSIKVKNSGGITVGVGDVDYINLSVAGTTSILKTLRSNDDFVIQSRQGSSNISALYIDSSANSIGIYTTAPTATLDVNGDAKIRGNLTVTGETLFVEATTLRIADHQLELGITEDSTVLQSDSEVDNGGIILQSPVISKDLTWNLATEAWTSNQNFNLSTNYLADPAYKIDGTIVVKKTSLGSSITQALGLQQIGHLTELAVDYLSFNGKDITSSTTGISIFPNGDIDVNNNKIINIDPPIADKDATNKKYVDDEIISVDVLISVDATGLIATANPSDVAGINNIRLLLNNMKVATDVAANTYAKVLATTYENATISGISITVTNSDTNDPSYDGTAALAISYTTVRDAANLGTESVVQDIQTFNTIAGAITLSPYRFLYTFQSSGGFWNFVSVSAV